jgi:hypothetical protein
MRNQRERYTFGYELWRKGRMKAEDQARFDRSDPTRSLFLFLGLDAPLIVMSLPVHPQERIGNVYQALKVSSRYVITLSQINLVLRSFWISLQYSL